MQKLKVIFQIILVVVFLATILFVQLTYDDYKGNVKYSSLKINIDDSSSLGFISKNEIIQKINGFNIKKGVTPIKDLPLAAIEIAFRNNPYLNGVEVYSDITGRLNIDIKQFIPKIRIIDTDGISYFVDDQYKVVPQRHYVNMPIPVVTQSDNVIPVKYLAQAGRGDSLNNRQKLAHKRIDLLYNFMECLDGNDVVKSLVSQVHINSSGDIELIPRIGNHLITFCGIDSLENCEKRLNKMTTFYSSQTNNGVWTQYSKVNFKFNGQVVCKKNKK